MKNFLLGLLLAGALPAFAADKTIKVEDAWARESPPAIANGAAYMTLINLSNEVDRLVGAAGEVAGTIELHTHLMEGGVMKMRPVQAMEVNPGEPTVLKPGGLHVMLIGLKKPLVAGERFPLTLKFEKAGEIPVEVEVRKMGMEGAMPGHHGHKM